MDEVMGPDDSGEAAESPRLPDAVRDVTFGDRWVYLSDPDALVIADTHIGRGPTTNVAFPLDERRRLVDRLTSLLDRHTPEVVIVAGDLLDSFGSLPRGVGETVGDFVQAAEEAGVRFVVTPGNHDTMLDVAYDGERSPAVTLDDGTVVAHGHELPAANGDRYVIGHDHPAITVGGHRYPCILIGPAGNADDATAIVLPPFSTLPRGTTVNGRLTSEADPLVADLDAFRPVVTTDGDPRIFPPLGQFRDRL